MEEKPYIAVLRSEFAAEEGSFLLKLRGDLKWDRAAFLRLVTAMAQCCLDNEAAEALDRQLADGFWYVSWFVQSWASHDNFRWEFPPDYYEDAFRLLFDFASYYFSGNHPDVNRRFEFVQDRIEGGEQRWQTIGEVDGCLLLLVAHTIREQVESGEFAGIIRIISARPGNRKERQRYDQEFR